nr:hypothetical protein Iba_chr04aCG18430 [Ipomoea batatas]
MAFSCILKFLWRWWCFCCRLFVKIHQKIQLCAKISSLAVPEVWTTENLQDMGSKFFDYGSHLEVRSALQMCDVKRPLFGFWRLR